MASVKELLADSENLKVPTEALTRQVSALCENPDGPSSFAFGPSHRSYRHQFSNLYFVRLRLIKDAVERRARSKWKDVEGSPTLAPRVLEVVKNKTCFIIGTIYMEMPLKPNVMEDVSRDRSIPAPPALEKIFSPDDSIMLEDESGRIQLVGDAVTRALEENAEHTSGDLANLLVTGVIMAALGQETATGDFMVLDVCFSGMAPMLVKNPVIGEDSMAIDGESSSDDDWVAVISGLELSSSEEDMNEMELRMQLLTEYLSCEVGGSEDQRTASRISRLIVAGDSLASTTNPRPRVGASTVDSEKRTKRFGLETTLYSSVPLQMLGSFLQDVTELMPVHLLPGTSDPLGTLLPQQPFPRGMFGALKDNKALTLETNPSWITVESQKPNSSSDGERPRSILVHSGQPIDDMFKYVPSSSSQARLDLACASLEWQHMAPTAPDTLWCYPYFSTDPFIIKGSPDVFLVGCQPSFATRLVSDSDDDGQESSSRVVLVPRFSDTGTVILVNLRNLDVKTVSFGSKFS